MAVLFEDQMNKFVQDNDDQNAMYKINGRPLPKDENDNPIDPQLLLKNMVDDFVNKGYENIILLSGAGTSVENTHTMGKTMGQLGQIINKRMGSGNTHYYSLEKLMELVKFEIPLDNSGNFNPSKFQLEQFISKVVNFIPYATKSKAKLIRSKDKILSIIKDETSYEFDDAKLNHKAVIKSLADRVEAPHRLAIVTTNYDVMFEQAADELEFTVIDGFSWTSKPYFNSDEFEWQLVKSVPNMKTKELDYKENVIELLKIHGSITWQAEGDKVYRMSKERVEHPKMIFPSSNKYAQSYMEPYFELFTKFQELLRQNNTLLITSGFSFGDVHISEMIESALRRNKGLSLLVTDYSIDDTVETPKSKDWRKIEAMVKDGFDVAFLKSSFNDLAQYVGERNEFG